MNSIRSAHVSVASLFIVVPLCFAGELAPPAGPVAPTFKTLHEVEPSTPIGPLTTPGDADALYVITQPGPYHLTEDLIGEPAKYGIQILAEHVSIDLRGFTVLGVFTSLSGIMDREPFGDPWENDISIRNGTVRDWGGIGVDLERTYGARVEGVTVVSNGSRGISVSERGLVRSCHAIENVGQGISTESSSVVVECTSWRNGGGFGIGSYSTIERCTSVGNSGGGFSSGQGSRYISCTSKFDQGNGFTSG